MNFYKFFYGNSVYPLVTTTENQVVLRLRALELKNE